MKIIHYSEAEGRDFGSPAKDVIGRVVVGKADGADNFCMRIFELAPGGYTPRHAHPWEHEQDPSAINAHTTILFPFTFVLI